MIKAVPHNFAGLVQLLYFKLLFGPIGTILSEQKPSEAIKQCRFASCIITKGIHIPAVGVENEFTESLKLRNVRRSRTIFFKRFPP